MGLRLRSVLLAAGVALLDTVIVGARAADYKANAVAAINTLQQWYIPETGLWNITGWWNSGNIVTTLAAFTILDPNAKTLPTDFFQLTFERAQRFNLKTFQDPNACPTTVCTKKRSVHGAEVQEYFHDDAGEAADSKKTFAGHRRIEPANKNGFSNGFFDDMGWWALAWMRVYDLTKVPTYLDAAKYIFENLERDATNATCGGVWWDRKKTANTAISNALFLSTAAHLATRVPEKKDYYLAAAIKQWQWFERTGLINERNQINDGLDLVTCKNKNDEVWSYNQGVILGALVEINKLAPNATMMRRATDVADAALKYSTDANGILHDPREPNLGGDGYQFKGIFARNLKELYLVTRKPEYKAFLERNADSIWNRARNASDNRLTGTWSGPYDAKHAYAASQSSALDAIVAAAAVQGV